MVSVKKLDVCIAIVGKSGMGALEYYPENIFLQKEEQMSLDENVKEYLKLIIQKVLIPYFKWEVHQVVQDPRYTMI